jgi:hypothetical protein
VEPDHKLDDREMAGKTTEGEDDPEEGGGDERGGLGEWLHMFENADLDSSLKMHQWWQKKSKEFRYQEMKPIYSYRVIQN